MMITTRRSVAALRLVLPLIAASLLAGCTGRGPGPTTTSAGAVSLPASVADDWAGKVVVIDFWATWCGPCRASSPNVQILADRFASDDRVLVVGVHADDSVEDPGAYMAEHRYTYPLVAKGEEIADAFGVNALPTFVVLDRQGKVAYRSVGMMTQKTRDAIEAKARELRG